MINKRFVILTLILMIVAVIAGFLILINKEKIKEKIIENSDLTNSVYQVKIYRLNLLPRELFSVGFIFLLISLVILFQERINQFIPKINYNVLFIISLIGIVTFFLISNYYYMNHVRILGPDEGFHINNAKLVHDGKIPYIDFPYVKGFLFPYIQGLFLQIGGGYNFFTSRMLALVFKLLSLSLVILISLKIGTRFSAIIASMFFVLNIGFISYIVGIFPNGVIEIFLLLLLFYLLTTEINDKLKAIFSMILISILIDIRLLLLPLLFLFLVYFYLETKHFFSALITSVLSFTAIYIIPIVLDPKKTYMGVYGFLASRAAFMPILTKQLTLGSDLTTLSGKLRDKLVNVVISAEFYNVLLFLFILFVLVYIIKAIKNKRKIDAFHSYIKKLYSSRTKNEKILILMGVSIIFVSCLSLIPTPTSYSYLTILLPLAAIFASICFVWLIRDIEIMDQRTLAIIMILLIFVTPLVQYPREQYVIRNGKIVNTLSEIKDVGDYVASKTSKEDYLMTFETPVAVEANRKVLPGFERSIFLYIPTMKKEEAERLGVLNTDIIVDYLNNKKAKAVIFSQLYSYETLELLPEDYKLINESLNKNYYIAKTYPEVLDWGRVDVYLLK